MSEIKHLKKYLTYNSDYEPPEKKLVSQGDILIKELSEKQSKTTVNLNELLNDNKTFQKATTFIPISDTMKGTSTLTQFEEASKTLTEVQKLKDFDLTNEDIALLDDWNKGETFFFAKHNKGSSEVLRERIEELHKIIQNSEEDTKNNQEGQNRDLLKTALAVKPHSVETKLLKFALENKKLEKPFPHPLDNISELEKSMFPKDEEQDIQKIRRKARKLANRLNNEEKVEKIQDDEKTEYLKYKVRNSKWDCKELPKEQQKKTTVKTFTCKPLNYYTIQDGEIVKLTPEEVDAKKLDIPRQKLTVEEIKSLPKFKNYTAGDCSKKLFIKNLPNITEESLKAICENLGVRNVETYQLMHGKMKGQAFIHFSDNESATKALEELNGLFVKDKPMIVQYGREK